MTLVCVGHEFDQGNQLELFQVLLLFSNTYFTVFFFFLASFVVDVQNVLYCFLRAIVMGSPFRILLSCIEYSFWCSKINLKVAGSIISVLFYELVSLWQLWFVLVDRLGWPERGIEAVLNTTGLFVKERTLNGTGVHDWFCRSNSDSLPDWNYKSFQGLLPEVRCSSLEIITDVINFCTVSTMYW